MPVCAYCAYTRIEPVCFNSVGPSGYHKFSLPVQHHSNVEFVHKILSTVFSIPSYSQRDRCQLLIQCVSDCRSRDPEFDPGLVAYLEIDHEIISIVILLPSTDCWGLYRGRGTKYPISLEVNRKYPFYRSGNTTITNCRQPHGSVKKSHSTITRHQEDNLSKATNSLSLSHQDDC